MYTYHPISEVVVKKLVIRLATVHADKASFKARVDNMVAVYTRAAHLYTWSPKSVARAILGNATGRL